MGWLFIHCIGSFLVEFRNQRFGEANPTHDFKISQVLYFYTLASSTLLLPSREYLFGPPLARSPHPNKNQPLIPFPLPVTPICSERTDGTRIKVLLYAGLRAMKSKSKILDGSVTLMLSAELSGVLLLLSQ